MYGNTPGTYAMISPRDLPAKDYGCGCGSNLASLDQWLLAADEREPEDESNELSGSRRLKRRTRRFKRAGDKGRESRQAVILFRVAAPGRLAGEHKLTRRQTRKGIRATRKAAKTKSLVASVILGLRAAGVSAAAAKGYVRQALSKLGKGKGASNAVTKPLQRKSPFQASRVSQRTRVTAQSAPMEENEEGLESENDFAYEQEDGEEGADLIDADMEENTDEFAGLPTAALKQYAPWLFGAAGAVFLVLLSREK